MGSAVKLVIAMVIWGSLGIFIKNINMESFEIAFLRATIASLFLGLILIIKSRINKNKKVATQEEVFVDGINKVKTYSKKGLIMLIVSGIAVGFNWVFLFQSYKYTTVSNATLVYYFAPAIVIFLSPIIFKERITVKALLSVVAATFGLLLVINSQGEVVKLDSENMRGIIIAFGAACFYALIIILNKYIEDFDDYQRTFIQLLSSTIVLAPFIIYRNNLNIPNSKSFLLIIILGVVHTGIAYILYFSAIKKLKSQTSALLSYIDPVSAIILSAIFLSEPLSIWKIVGGIIILVSAIIGKSRLKNEISNNY